MVNHIVVENQKGDLPYGALEEKITLENITPVFDVCLMYRKQQHLSI